MNRRSEALMERFRKRNQTNLEEQEMTRIRFKKNEAGMYVTTKAVMAGKDFVTVSLDPTTVSATYTGSDGTVLLSDAARTMKDLKVMVKKNLVNMGALFDQEVRKSKKLLDGVSYEDLEKLTSNGKDNLDEEYA